MRGDVREASTRRTFHTLDGLRGVAAIAVMCLHFHDDLAPLSVGNAYLAVDLFFLMSGFVLAHAYAERLEGGLGARRFMLIRFVRLYPLYILGTLIGLVFPLVAVVHGAKGAWTTASLAAAAVPALAMLPGLPLPGMRPELYQLDIPVWSLAFEMAVNLLWAFAVGRRWRLSGAAILIALPGVVAAALVYHGLDTGWRWPELWPGLARAAFSFFLGVALWRRHVAKPPSAPRVPPVVLLAIAAALLGIAPPPGWRIGYDLACVVVAFPALLWLAIANEPARGVTIFAALGAISYPLYVIHVPCKQLIGAIIAHVLHGDASAAAPGLGIGLMIGLSGVAWLLACSFDPWARRWLGARLLVERNERHDAPAALGVGPVS